MFWRYSARNHLRKALVVAHVVMGAGMAMAGFVTTFALLAVSQGLWGLGWALSSGADLNAIRDQEREAILLNILDPNRDVKPQFLSYILVTNAGRTVTGMITAETANAITLRRADGTGETVLRIDIEELRSTGVSFMPEGLEQQIDVPAMADLLAYLGSVK